MTSLDLLIVEDNIYDAELSVAALERAGFSLAWRRVDTPDEYLAALDTPPDLILSDYSMPTFSGPEAIELLKSRHLDIPLIIVSGTVGEDIAVECITQGASDYLLKDRLTRLGEAARRALGDRKLRKEKDESEERYRRLTENAPDIIYRWRATEPVGFEYINRVVESITGHKPEEFYTDPDLLLKLAHPEDRELVEQMLRGAGSKPIIFRILDPRGETIWLERSGVLVFDENGTLAAVEGIARNITDRIQIQNRLAAVNQGLEQQNNRLKLISRIGQQTTAILDMDNLLHEAVRLIGDMFDYSLTGIQLVEGNVLVLHAASHSVGSTGVLRLPVGKGGVTGRVAETGDAMIVPDISQEPLYYRVPGTESQSELAVPIKLHNEVIGVLNVESSELNAFSSDDRVTLETIADQLATAIHNAKLYYELSLYSEVLEQAVEERTAELRGTTERIETILSSMGDALMLLRLDGRIEQVNPAFEIQTGYAVVDAEMKDYQAMLEIDFGSKGDYQAAVEALTPGKVWHAETRVRRKDGTTYDGALTFAPLRNEKGAIRQLVVSIRDITPLKEVERAKDQFVSNVSHELRTPITSLRLNQRLLERDPDGADRYLERIGREIDRLNELIEDLLRLSRMDQGSVQLNLQPLDLNTLAEQYSGDRAPLAEHRDLKLAFEPTPDLPTISADVGLLGQALSVLLTNALNYTPAGGVVTITTGRREAEGKRWVGFGVKDTGPGLQPGEEKELFNRFFRGSAGRNSGAPGTGLGLAIAWEIVNRHGGRIEVASGGAPGQGAVFDVWIPIAEAQPDDRGEKS